MTELRKLARHRLLRATLRQRLNRTAILKKKGDNLIWEKEVRKKITGLLTFRPNTTT